MQKKNLTSFTFGRAGEVESQAGQTDTIGISPGKCWLRVQALSPMAQRLPLMDPDPIDPADTLED
jgi:hypothetical protein